MKRFSTSMLAMMTVCVLSAQHQATANSGSIGGNVTGVLTEKPVYPGMVIAFISTDQGAFPAVDSTELSETGEYRFMELDTGRYTFRVLPGPLPNTAGIPTYLGDVVLWTGARFIQVDSALVDTLQDIVLREQLPAHPGDQTGKMSGNVSYSDSVASKGTLAKPVTRSSVVLVRKATSKGTQGENVSGHVETDDQGNFSFSDVPEGDYGLIVDIAGMPMFNTYDIRIDSGAVVTGMDFVVGNIGINTADKVDVKSIAIDRFVVFPNPGNGLIHIEFPVQGEYGIRIYSLTGKLVAARKFSSPAGPETLDLTNLVNGTYIIRIEGKGASGVLRYVKR